MSADQVRSSKCRVVSAEVEKEKSWSLPLESHETFHKGSVFNLASVQKACLIKRTRQVELEV